MTVFGSRIAAALLAITAVAPMPVLAQAQFTPPTGLAWAPQAGLLIHTPREAITTTPHAVAHVLGRTAAGARVSVAGEVVTVQRTGVFARDNVPLTLGANTLRIEATLPDGNTLTQYLQIERLAPPALTPSQAGSAAPAMTDAKVVESLPASLYAAGPGGVALTHGVHEVRLGGPYLAELPPGTLLMVTGRAASHYRVALAPDTTVWAPINALAAAAPGLAQPWASFTSLTVEAAPQASIHPPAAGQKLAGQRSDTVSIPIPDGLPFAVRALPSSGSGAQLELDLFGGHLATTWITHRASATLIREVSVQQPADGRLRVSIALHSRTLWGWRVEHSGGLLKLTVQAPPERHSSNSHGPLLGMRVALEAGHGGPSNLGAIGATGVPEKDVNRWTAEALKAELEAAGAQVWMVRAGDDNPSLAERAARVEASDAQLFISVHANAVDPSRGVLRVQGSSTYFRHAHQRDLATAIQRRLLEQTGLADFGVVGAFNYLPLRRITGMPAVLVEQAFMTHPADEAQMLDPAFRVRIARAVRMGVEDFVREALGSE